MPFLIFVGWVIGVAIATALPATSGAILSLGLLIVAYIVGYLIATAATAPLLPAFVGSPVTFPVVSQIPTPGGAAVTVPATGGEFFARGFLIGLTASSNAVVLAAIPVAGSMLASWAFFVISIGAIIFVARNRVYQGFLGWSAWLFPISYIATFVGLLLFLVNIPFAFAVFGLGAFRIDWTTGVIETAGGLSGITGFSGGFSLGNFNFLTALPAPGDFTIPSLSSHETGHSLNTSISGGIVLWINAVDENIWPRRLNLAYGELLAEGHSRAMPGAATPDYSIRLWY